MLYKRHLTRTQVESLANGLFTEETGWLATCPCHCKTKTKLLPRQPVSLQDLSDIDQSPYGTKILALTGRSLGFPLCSPFRQAILEYQEHKTRTLASVKQDAHEPSTLAMEKRDRKLCIHLDVKVRE